MLMLNETFFHIQSKKAQDFRLDVLLNQGKLLLYHAINQFIVLLKQVWVQH
jgi:hypothetical protein